MSNAVFPTLGGLDIKVKRAPLWSTEVLTSESGKEQRAAWWSTPRFKWSLGFNYLRQGLNGNEAKTLVDFFHQHRGQFESFLFSDPYESAVTAKQFGTGDGVTSAYQLVDGAGYSVTELNGIPTIYRTDWQGTYQLFSTSRTNWIKYSEDVTKSDWAKGASGTASLPIVTGDYTVAPNGTLTADRVQFNHGAGITSVDTSNLQASSVVQSGSVNWCHSVWMKTNDGTTRRFHMSIAGAGSIVAVVTPTWQRFPVIFNGNGAFNLRIFYRGDLDANQTADVSIWGAQGEVGSVPTGYILNPSNGSVTVTDYTITSAGLVTLAASLATGSTLTWTGAYYRRVRFDMDELDLERIYGGTASGGGQTWEGKTVKLISVK